MTEDIIARIDAALGCQYCRKDLDPDGPSPDFCGEPCRSAWHAKLGDPLPPVKVEGRPERVFVVVDEFVERLDIELAPWQRSWLSSWYDRMRGRHR